MSNLRKLQENATCSTNMVKAFYFLRVCVLSFEAVLIALAIYLLMEQQSLLDALAAKISVNDDVLKGVMLSPLALAAWIFLEAKKLVFEKDANATVLTAWEDFWKLKCHINVSLVYACVFLFVSLLPWLDKRGISVGSGLVLFLLALVGQAIVALSIYNAGFQLQEILVGIPKDGAKASK